MYVCYVYLTRVKRSHGTRDKTARESRVRGRACNFMKRFRTCRDSTWMRLATFASQKNSYRELLMLPTFRRAKLPEGWEGEGGIYTKRWCERKNLAGCVSPPPVIADYVTQRLHTKFSPTRRTNEMRGRDCMQIDSTMIEVYIHTGVHPEVIWGMPSRGKHVLRFL